MSAVRAELATIQSIATAALENDFGNLNRWLPLSKRGGNLQRVIDSLRNRLETIQTCAADGLQELDRP